MNKTIITIYGRYNEGKTSTIRNVYNMLMSETPIPIMDRDVPQEGDILVVLTIGDIRIGIESEGDPNGRMITENTLQQLAESNCDIILCASRTRGTSVKLIDHVAIEFNYNTLWTSSNYSPRLDHEVLNTRLAENIKNIIDDIRFGRL